MAGCDGAHRLIADRGKTETRRSDADREEASARADETSPHIRNQTMVDMP
jgi:CDGSH-type Zn-finger protein